jgi:hypothetical protein
MEGWAAGTPGSLCHAGAPGTSALRSTAVAAVEPAFDPVAAQVEPVLRMVATQVEPVFDAVAFDIESLFGAIAARTFHPLVDAFAARVKMLIGTLASTIEALVDALAARIETLVCEIAAIPSHGRNRHQRQQSSSKKGRFGLHGYFSGIWEQGLFAYTRTTDLLAFG